MRAAVRFVLIGILIAIFGLIIYEGWRKNGASQFEAAFNPGGKLSLDLSAGGYRVVGTSENKIRIQIDSHDEREAQCRINVNGSKAIVEIEGPSNNFHVTIFVPQRTDLTVDQTIGELMVTNVEGNKRLGLNIGRLQVEVPNSGVVPSFDGSVIIGSLRAPVWHVEKGGFFRGMTMQAGQPTIKAHVDIGDLEVVGVGPASGDSHAQKSENADEDVPEKDSEN